MSQDDQEMNTSNVKPFRKKGSMVQPLDYPDLDDNRILDTPDNLKCLLDHLGIKVRYNEMKRQREIAIKDFKFYKEKQQIVTLRKIHTLALKYRMPVCSLDELLDVISFENPYHPIRDFILSKPWDGVSRLQDFMDCLDTNNKEFDQLLIKTWLISVVAAAFSEEGFASQGVLVFTGEQFVGKTSWFNSLFPSHFHAVLEGIILDPGNKDHVITCASFLIGELGELDGTFRKSDIAKLKSFITKSSDRLRAPFARKDEVYARRTIFGASVNSPNFLIDQTGNRRWWTVSVNAINSETIDRQQLWAEIHSLFLAGHKPTLDRATVMQLSESNKKHEMVDPLLEGILDLFDWSEGWQKSNTQDLSSTAVLRMLNVKPNAVECTRIGQILRKLTGKKPSRNKLERLHTLPRFLPK